jgi:hypothetical protein
VALDGGSGKAIREDDCRVVGAALEAKAGLLIQATAEVRTAQVGSAIGSGAVQENVRQTESWRVQFFPDGVASAGMIQLEA